MVHSQGTEVTRSMFLPENIEYFNNVHMWERSRQSKMMRIYAW